jgi:DnaA family protein
MKQIPLPIATEVPRTFDNFLAGANRAALEHLAALAPGAPPVYLWGPTGSGKTHLLRAVASRAQRGDGRVGWFGAADPAPWARGEPWSVVLLDDCEAFDAAQQQEAFALFVEAAPRQVAIVAAGRMPPVDLPLREDLRTRLGWGHVFALRPLADAEARSALRREAERRGVFLSDDVIDFLLNRFARDLKHLMGLLERLDTYALASKRSVTVPLLKDMLADGAER